MGLNQGFSLYLLILYLFRRLVEKKDNSQDRPSYECLSPRLKADKLLKMAAIQIQTNLAHEAIPELWIRLNGNPIIAICIH